MIEEKRHENAVDLATSGVVHALECRKIVDAARVQGTINEECIDKLADANYRLASALRELSQALGLKVDASGDPSSIIEPLMREFRGGLGFFLKDMVESLGGELHGYSSAGTEQGDFKRRWGQNPHAYLARLQELSLVMKGEERGDWKVTSAGHEAYQTFLARITRKPTGHEPLRDSVPVA
jgi:hypothetical protein